MAAAGLYNITTRGVHTKRETFHYLNGSTQRDKTSELKMIKGPPGVLIIYRIMP